MTNQKEHSQCHINDEGGGAKTSVTFILPKISAAKRRRYDAVFI